MGKKLVRASIVSLILFSLLNVLSTSVFAASTFSQSLKGWMRFFFVDLTRATASNLNAVIVFKFVIWILTFALVFFGVKRLFTRNDLADFEGKHKNIPLVISLVISLMGILMIPNAWVVTMFELYSTIFGIFLMLAPGIAGIAINLQVLGDAKSTPSADDKPKASAELSPKFKHFMRAIIYLIIFYVYGTLILSTIAKVNTPVYDFFYTFGSLGLTFVFILMLLELVFGLTAEGSPSASSTTASADLAGKKSSDSEKSKSSDSKLKSDDKKVSGKDSPEMDPKVREEEQKRCKYLLEELHEMRKDLSGLRRKLDAVDAVDPVLDEKKKAFMEVVLELLNFVDSSEDSLNSAGRASKEDETVVEQHKRRISSVKKYVSEVVAEAGELFWLFVWDPVLMFSGWEGAFKKLKRFDHCLLKDFHRQFNHIEKWNGKMVFTLGLNDGEGEYCEGVCFAFPKKEQHRVHAHIRKVLGKDMIVVSDGEGILNSGGVVKCDVPVNKREHKVFFDWSKAETSFDTVVSAMKAPLAKKKLHGKMVTAKKYVNDVWKEFVRHGYNKDKEDIEDVVTAVNAP